VYNQALNTNNNVYFYQFQGSRLFTPTYRVANGGQWNADFGGGNGWRTDSGSWYTYGAVGAAYFYGTSTREVKKNITTFDKCAICLIKETLIVNFKYDFDNGLDNQKIGFIAEDTPTELSSENHDKMIIPTNISIAIKAVQEIHKKILDLQNK
jgi:hypothetical protein